MDSEVRKGKATGGRIEGKETKYILPERRRKEG